MPAPRVLAPALALVIAIPAAAQPTTDRVPILKPAWKVTAVGLPEEEWAEPDDFSKKNFPQIARQMREAQARRTAWVSKLYADASVQRKAANRPLITPFVPRATDNWLVYHNAAGLVSRALGRRSDPEGEIKPGELMWECQHTLSLIGISKEVGRRHTLDQWMKPFDLAAEQVWSGTLVHAAAIDAGYALSVDELAILPPAAKKDAVPTSYGSYTEEASGYCLRRTSLSSGKLFSRIGPTGQELPRAAQPLPDSVRFVSVPLPGTDGVTFLTERDRSLWATRLNFDRYHKAALAGPSWSDPRFHRKALTEEAIWELELVKAPTSLVHDPHRRIHAIHLVESNGLVICPTHLGRVIAVDAKTGKAKWTHEYAPLAAKRFPTFAPEWVVVPPVVADGKYVYAPADFPELLCLDAATGNKLWATAKGDGLYPAVVGDTVLVVGEKIVRGLSLKDGTGTWRVELPGLPCGRGVVLGNDYLVPVSEPKTWKGLIAVIDVKAGKVREVLKAGDEPIGNLVVHQEYLISQTLTELAVFPLKKRN